MILSEPASKTPTHPAPWFGSSEPFPKDTCGSGAREYAPGGQDAGVFGRPMATACVSCSRESEHLGTVANGPSGHPVNNVSKARCMDPGLRTGVSAGGGMRCQFTNQGDKRPIQRHNTERRLRGSEAPSPVSSAEIVSPATVSGTVRRLDDRSRTVGAGLSACSPRSSVVLLSFVGWGADLDRCYPPHTTGNCRLSAHLRWVSPQRSDTSWGSGASHGGSKSEQ